MFISRLIISSLLALSLLGAGCQQAIKQQESLNPSEVPVSVKSGAPSARDDFEMKLKCKPFLNEVEKNNETLKGLGILPLVPYVCYSKAKNSCISVQGYLQDGDTQWEVKDLLTGEVLNVLAKATNQESGAALRGRVDSVKDDLNCVN